MMRDQRTELNEELTLLNIALRSPSSEFVEKILLKEKSNALGQIEMIETLETFDYSDYASFYDELQNDEEAKFFPLYFNRSKEESNEFPFELGEQNWYEINHELAEVDLLHEYIGYVGEAAIFRDKILRLADGYFIWKEWEFVDECGGYDFGGGYVRYLMP